MNGSFLTLKRPLRACSLVLGISVFLLMQKVVYGQTALTWARIETLRHRVQLIPSGQYPRVARINDTLGVGDALRTATSSRAELRFNDGSLARLGQRATFQFTPNTRNFQLSNGTILLLIPPDRGRTTIQTPNAVTGIQGSALFVRNIPETNTTIVGALTNNPAGPMISYNADGSQQRSLYAGQMIVIEGDEISQLFEFDILTFLQTSGLVEGLNLDQPHESLGTDELDEVRQEILEAIEGQEPVEGEDTTENPTFTRPPTISSELPESTDIFTPLAFPTFDDSPAQVYLDAAGEPSSSNANAASRNTPTASLNNTEEASQTRIPDVGDTSQETPDPGVSTPPSTDNPRTPVPADEFDWQGGSEDVPETSNIPETMPETSVGSDPVEDTFPDATQPEVTTESVNPDALDGNETVEGTPETDTNSADF